MALTGLVFIGAIALGGLVWLALAAVRGRGPRSRNVGGP